MTKREKDLSKIKDNPKNVRFSDLDRILLDIGFEKRQKGSHAVQVIERIIQDFDE